MEFISIFVLPQDWNPVCLQTGLEIVKISLSDLLDEESTPRLLELFQTDFTKTLEDASDPKKVMLRLIEGVVSALEVAGP